MYITCLNPSHWLLYAWVRQKRATHARRIAAVVARFHLHLLHCLHCSSSAHTMKKRQPLHTLIYGTMMGALMEGGALIVS
jgi:hypothetical protein